MCENWLLDYKVPFTLTDDRASGNGCQSTYSWQAGFLIGNDTTFPRQGGRFPEISLSESGLLELLGMAAKMNVYTDADKYLDNCHRSQ